MMNYKIPFEKSRPRQHYTSNGKSKKSYATEEEAVRYISRHRIRDMQPYLCRVCNKYHIGHTILIDGS